MLPVMASRYRPVGLGYTPWPLGQEAQAPGGGGGVSPEAVAPIVTAGGGAVASIISAIRGGMGPGAGYPPGTYPPAAAPFPWGTVLLIGGLGIGAVLLVRALGKRSNPRRRRRYRVYRRRR